jgi:hypothetical protein
VQSLGEPENDWTRGIGMEMPQSQGSFCTRRRAEKSGFYPEICPKCFIQVTAVRRFGDNVNNLLPLRFELLQSGIVIMR